MNDADLIGRIVREYHLRALPAERITRLHGSVAGSSASYRVVPDGQPPYVARAFRADGPVPVQFSGTAAEAMVDWVVGRAWTLARLEEVGYPAPRPVRPRSGELVGSAGPWLVWASTFVDGPVLRPSPDQLRLLGAALGGLHVAWAPGEWREPVGPGGACGPAESGRAAEPGRAVESNVAAELGGAGAWKAAWHPDDAVVTTLARLEAVAGLVPADWRSMHAAFVDIARAVQQGARQQGGGLLARALVHGDAWPGNAILTQPGQVTLIDWETAGVGLPVLDLGNCLASCSLAADLPPDRPEAWLVEPREECIAAIAAGYSARRLVPEAERELLPAAVGFGAAFIGAIHFEAALIGGASGPSMAARLARLRHRLETSGEVAALALRHLGQPAG